MTRLSIGLLVLFFSGVVLAEKAPPIKGDWKPDQIAENVFVIHGPLETPSLSNQGFMNNPGFLVTEKGVVLVDPGGSVQVGEMLLAEVEKITDKPVIAVFNTHVHGDHWLGNHAVQDKYPDVKIYAHPKMIEAVTNGAGEEWMAMVMQLTEGAVSGTEVVNATHPIDNGDTVKIAGLHFDIYHNGKAHTHTDIMIHIPEKQVMFLGDNASVNRLVRNEGSIKGNIQALEIAAKTQTRVFVPGHGPSGPDSNEIYMNYLKVAYKHVRKGYDEDMSDFEIKPMVEAAMADYHYWADFDRLLGKHVNSIYHEIETAEF